MKLTKTVFEALQKELTDFQAGKADDDFKKAHKEWAIFAGQLLKTDIRFGPTDSMSWQNSGYYAKYFWSWSQFFPLKCFSIAVGAHINKQNFSVGIDYQISKMTDRYTLAQYNDNFKDELYYWANSIKTRNFVVGKGGSGSVDNIRLEDLLNDYNLLEKLLPLSAKEYFTVLYYIDCGNLDEIDSDNQDLQVAINELGNLYQLLQPKEILFSELVRSKDIIPSQYDGSYELVKTIVNCYKAVSKEKLTIDDMNAMFFMSVGTFSEGLDVKIKLIEKSNLDDADKSKMVGLLRFIASESQNGKYENSQNGNFGMFGVGFHTFNKGKATNHAAIKFINLALEMESLDSDYNFALQKHLSVPIEGVGVSTLSTFLHCLKPDVFPIINGKQGDGVNVYSELGIELVHPRDIKNYANNMDTIKLYRDKYFTFKNYRVFDLLSSTKSIDQVQKEEISNTIDFAGYVGSTGNDENGIYTDFSERCISEGIWLSGWTDKHLDLVKSVKVGDRIALKSISNKKYDLPFDNNGKSVGYMIIKAIGIVVENCGDGRNLKVDWQKVEPVAKEWFGEGLCMGTIHYIEGCGSLIKQALLNFTFENAPQDYDICEQYYSDVKTNGQICENIINDCMRVPRMPRSSIIHPLNIILYGAPGTGKTYSTIDYAVAIIKKKKLEEYENIPRLEIQDEFKSLVIEKKIAFSTFHQSYGYEDFMQGMRPVLNDGVVSFKIVDGVFKSISDRAMADPTNNYVIIIDEINRANISKVFGELITLIEDDKRWGELNEISSTLSSGEIFAVPNNLYIIGTMNSADKSISLIDTALRRRFLFLEVVPDSSKIEDEMFKKILEKLNSELVNELDSTDLLIGHSYFMGKSECDLCSIMNNSIIPLLYEYFYDNSKKVKKILSIVLKDYNYDVSKGSFGRFKIFQKVIENDIK